MELAFTLWGISSNCCRYYECEAPPSAQCKKVDKHNPPNAINGHLTGAGINEDILKEGDVKLQRKAVLYAIVGTFIWGFADALLDYLLPLSG